MPASALLLPLLLAPPVLAGDLLVETTVPAEIALGSTSLVATWGPARLRVMELEPGLAGIRVVRGDRTDVIDVLVPDNGAAALRVGADGVSTQPVQEPEQTPVVELRAARGQRFAVVVDGQRAGVIGSKHPVRLEGIGAGEHSLELRTADLTVVWNRGTLDLREDDIVVLTGQEGYAPLVSGRPDVFMLQGSGGNAAPPAETLTLPAPTGG